MFIVTLHLLEYKFYKDKFYSLLYPKHLEYCPNIVNAP